MGSNGDRNKIILIVGGVALAYVAVIGFGLGTGGGDGTQPPTDDKGDFDAWSSDPDAVTDWVDNQLPDWLKSLDFLPTPKVEFSEKELIISKNTPKTLLVKRSDGDEYRQAQFTLINGAEVEIVYDAINAQEHNGEKETSFQLTKDKVESFVVGKSGGRFVIRVAGGSSTNARIKLN